MDGDCSSATVTIRVVPVNDAPVVINEYETICNTSSLNGNILANGDSDPDGTSLSVVTTPVHGPAQGIFSILPNGDYTYTPSPTSAGTDTIVLSVCDNGIPMPSACTNDTIVITIIPSVIMTAGSDTTVCEREGSVILSGSKAQNYNAILWTTNGTGTFNNPALVNPTYSPGVADITAGNVILTMHATGLVPCGDNTSALTLSFALAPSANAGDDATICNSATYDFGGVSASNYSALLWEFSPANAGTLSDATMLKPVFSPTPGFTGNVTLTLKAFGSPVCSTVVESNAMILTVVTGVTIDAGVNQIISTGATTTLHGTASGGSGIYAWIWEPSTLLQSNILPEPTTLPIYQQTRFTTTVVDVISGCSTQDEVVVSIKVDATIDFASTMVNTATTIDVLHNDSDPGTETRSVSICGDPANGVVLINQDNSITYTPDTKFIGNDKFCYMICNNGNPDICDTATVFIHVIAKLDDLVIYNLLTPNGDNSNDTWAIKGIEDFPENTIIIFNRWGDKVRDFSKYDNINVFWDGTNNKGEVLPSGTYYYILKIKDVGSRTGWIYLHGKEE